MQIRTAVMADLAAVTAVEAACFPAAEAATEREFARRLAVYPNHFWLLEEAARVMERVIADARAQGRKGCVLTCKDRLIHYYETFGFQNEGVSSSTHGGVVWYDMRLIF